MKTFFKYAFAGLLAMSLGSCEDDEQNITDLVQETVETGAILRTIDFTDELILDVAPEQFVLTLEEQDEQEGGLLQEVNVYVTYTDNSDIAGNSSGFNTEEVLIDTVPASEFSPGPFGLPRVTVTYPVSDLLAAVGGTSTDQIYVDDTFRFREELVLTDGRVFTAENAGTVITTGFFNSPFQHVQTVTGGLNISFRDQGFNQVNIAAGQPNDGYSAVVQVQEVIDNLWSELEVFVSYQDNLTDPDNPVAGDEMSLGVFTRDMFTLDATTINDDDEVVPLEMAVGAQINFSLDELLTGIGMGIDELFEGDQLNIRYAIVNSSGRQITSPLEPFTVPVPVIDCQLPVIPDEFFVGTYLIEQTSGVGPFDGTFGPQYSSQIVEVALDPTANESRTFVALLHPDPGGFSFEVQAFVQFSCGAFLMSNDGGAAAGGSLGCNGGLNSITDGPADNPAIFDLSIDEDGDMIPDVTDDVLDITLLGFGLDDGGCDVPAYEIGLRFTKQ